MLCLNLEAQTFHRSTLYPPRNKTTCTRDLLGISAFTKLTKGFKKWFLSVQSRLSLVLSASRDERRRRKGNPERKTVRSGFQCSFKTESCVNARREAGVGGKGPAALAPDEEALQSTVGAACSSSSFSSILLWRSR